MEVPAAQQATPEGTTSWTDTTVWQEESTEPSSMWAGAWLTFRQDRAALASLGVIVFLIAICIIGPAFTGHTYARQDYSMLDDWPSANHWLGTDDLGRDVLTRLLYALRISFLVAFVSEGLIALLGTAIGVLAGYYGGWIDTVASRVTDLTFAFPGLLLVVLVMSMFGDRFDGLFGGLGRMLMVFITFSLVGWPATMRLIRSTVLSLREKQYVESARACGTSDWNTIRRHILPGVWSMVLVWTSIDIRRIVINEAIISLLGLGIQPPMASLGTMIASGANRLNTNWGEVLWPSAILTILIVGFSFFGDGLRDAFDVRMRD